MLSGSAILRVLLLIVAAAGLAWIVQVVLLRGREPEAAAPTSESVSPGRSGDSGIAPSPPAPVRVVKPAAPAPPVAETPPPAPPVEAAAPPASVPPPVAQTPPVPPEPDPVVEAEENAPPAAVALVDLNTAPLAALNGLKGGGAIGRTIIQHRPYTSIDQLLSKRVLNRATYQRIKDQVTVQ